MPSTPSRLLAAGLLAATVVATAGVAQPAGRDPLPTVAYTALGKNVRALKGKIVLVYFWADS